MAQIYRFGLLEDFDHMYRYSALMDRVEGKDANTILQSYTDILPGRPTAVEHRHPLDDLRQPYDRADAALHHQAACDDLVAGEHQTHDYYMTRRSDLRRSVGAPALRGDRVDRGAARHAVRVAGRSAARPGSRSGCCTKPPRSTTTGAASSRRPTRG